ncbi:uncharacterized protein RCC_10605 [Ramularia collo-cygni]|uniref:Opioid growth factor receptor (OGFr) conserved domain-containing protein n=1 Tax=Ramularia collo-cygni TaxID=112498 RepID=A0A2D3V3M0_9PEZI|nr:uncharacterized protein RCC_10605 [Ramularia collo-cygni]CZT24877.1 uncharacterized protein RCC_10605 [Ramularia collo-cygni]
MPASARVSGLRDLITVTVRASTQKRTAETRRIFKANTNSNLGGRKLKVDSAAGSRRPETSKPNQQKWPVVFKQLQSTMSVPNATLGVDKIVRFYGEGAKDIEGRTLNEILNYENDTLEIKHDYIQFLFPLPEGSSYNVKAPIITRSTRDAFVERPDLRDQLFRSCERMAGFYGFNIVVDDTDYKFIPKPEFLSLATDTWMTRIDHNHLRISRIIRCLRILGHKSLALAFYDALLECDEEQVVGRKSLMYWERAAKRPLHLPPEEDDEDAEGVTWLRYVVPVPHAG